MHYNTICQYLSVYLKGPTASSPAIYLRSWNINPQCVIVDNDIYESPAKVYHYNSWLGMKIMFTGAIEDNWQKCSFADIIWK